MFAWILDGADREDAAATLGQLPPPLRLLYRAVWKPRLPRPRAGNVFRRRCGPRATGSMEHRAGPHRLDGASGRLLLGARRLGSGGADGGADFGLAGGQFGRVLTLEALGDVLVIAHQGVQVAVRCVEHAQVGVGPLDLLAPQPRSPRTARSG